MIEIKEKLNRILWIADVFPRPRQMTDGVWSLKTALAIQREGIEVIVLSPTPWIPKWLAFTSTLKGLSNVPHTHEIENLQVFYPKCPHYPKKAVRYYLYKYFPYFETSIIHEWCKETISFLVESHPFQVIHANFMFPSGYIGYKLKKKYGVPLVFHERSVRRLDTASKNKRLKKIYSRVLAESDLIITPSNKMADFIREGFHNSGNIQVVRDVGDIDIADDLIESKPNKYKTKKIVLSVGSLIERKGHQYLIKAIDKIKEVVPEIKCIIIGSEKRSKLIHDLISNLGLNDIVELYGELPHKEVLKTMSWCDVFVLPSWNEAFGTVNAEAMTFGKPIIGCMGEGISEVIDNGVQGLLVRKQDVDSLAEALFKILNDKSLALQMGKKSRELAEKELNYNFISSQIIDLYRGILY